MIFVLSVFLSLSLTSARAEEQATPSHLSLLPAINMVNYAGNTDSVFKLGLDYEYRLAFSEREWGVGLMMLTSFKAPSVQDYAFTLNYHPYMGVRAIAAGGGRRLGTNTWAFAKLGAAYDYNLMETFDITPMVLVELVDQHRLGFMAGLGLGCSF